jgi:hypothetical protein
MKVLLVFFTIFVLFFASNTLRKNNIEFNPFSTESECIDEKEKMFSVSEKEYNLLKNMMSMRIIEPIYKDKDQKINKSKNQKHPKISGSLKVKKEYKNKTSNQKDISIILPSNSTLLSINKTEDKIRIKEIERIIKKTTMIKNTTIYKKAKPEIIFKINLDTFENFFRYIVKGFNYANPNISNRNKNYDSKGNNIVENYLATFYCSSTEPNFGINLENFYTLKNYVKEIDYKNYQKSMIGLLLELKKIINHSVHKKCKGLIEILDSFEKYISNIRAEFSMGDYFTIINFLKNRTYQELDKFSFSEAGYTIGKMFSESRRYSSFT